MMSELNRQWVLRERPTGPVEDRHFALVEGPVPTPGPGEALVKLISSGVCHTDLHAAEGDWPVKPKLPLIPGHEGVGTVVGPVVGAIGLLLIEEGLKALTEHWMVLFGPLIVLMVLLLRRGLWSLLPGVSDDASGSAH